jgi:hypothetical protein
VSALELAVVTETTVLIFDKVYVCTFLIFEKASKLRHRENNTLSINGHPAWGSEFNLVTRQARPLNPITNTFCAAGGFLSNGTFFSVGGHPTVEAGKESLGCLAHDTDDLGENGLQSLRIFEPCSDGTCDVYEDSTRIRPTSSRWYPSSVCNVADIFD